MKSGLAVAVIMAALTSVAQAQDVAAGEQSFKKCLACHAVGEGAKNKIGPVLNGLEGRHSGSIPEYSYSDANKNSGLTWDEATFKDYIKDPRAKIPNTKMIFPASRMKRKPETCGPISDSLGRTVTRNRSWRVNLRPQLFDLGQRN